MTLVNLTPHAIHLNNGMKFEPSGKVMRVSDVYDLAETILVDGSEVNIYNMSTTKLKLEDLPNPYQEGVSNPGDVVYIVSGMVLEAIKSSGLVWHKMVAPATGHPDTVRNFAGQIVSVPGFIRLY